MPPTTPWAGIPRLAVVMARLVINDKDRGIKPYVVRLADAGKMCAGITSTVLPFRGGVKPVDSVRSSASPLPKATLWSFLSVRQPFKLLANLEANKCSGLAAEALLGRYELPRAKDPDCMLALYERGVWEEARTIAMRAADGPGRTEDFNKLILPHCRTLVEATGYRMAYEAASDSKDITQEVLALFEMQCIMADSSWYCEHGYFTRIELFESEARAFDAALPQLETLLDGCQAATWVAAPVVSESSWDDFMKHLSTFRI